MMGFEPKFPVNQSIFKTRKKSSKFRTISLQNIHFAGFHFFNSDLGGTEFEPLNGGFKDFK